jgi:hypothetical protein
VAIAMRADSEKRLKGCADVFPHYASRIRR